MSTTTVQRKEVRGGSKRLKVRSTSNGRVVEGYAIVTAPATSEDLGGFKERISKQALRGAITPGIDIALLWSHDVSQPLARTTSGTMQVEVRDKGLWFSATLPDSPRGEDVAETLRRKDTNSCSFGFITQEDSWQRQGDILIRTVEKMSIIELTLCLWPAYPDTSAALRSAQRSGVDLRSKLTSRESLDDIIFGHNHSDDDDAPSASDSDDSDEEDDDENRCACRCSSCVEGRCDSCSMTDCDDDNCEDCPYSNDDSETGSRSLLTSLLMRRMQS